MIVRAEAQLNISLSLSFDLGAIIFICLFDNWGNWCTVRLKVPLRFRFWGQKAVGNSFPVWHHFLDKVAETSPVRRSPLSTLSESHCTQQGPWAKMFTSRIHHESLNLQIDVPPRRLLSWALDSMIALMHIVIRRQGRWRKQKKTHHRNASTGQGLEIIQLILGTPYLLPVPQTAF